MEYLDEKSFADALTLCHNKSETKVVIVFASDRSFYEFAGEIHNMAVLNLIAGVNQYQPEYSVLRFKNGSEIRLQRPSTNKILYPFALDRVIYEKEEDSQSLDSFLNEFKIKK